MHWARVTAYRRGFGLFGGCAPWHAPWRCESTSRPGRTISSACCRVLPRPPVSYIVEEISRRNRRLAIVELGAGNLGVGVDEGLLVDAPNSLQIADIERILGPAIARMLALKFAMGLLLSLGLFQRDDLRLGQHQAFLGTLGF